MQIFWWFKSKALSKKQSNYTTALVSLRPSFSSHTFLLSVNQTVFKGRNIFCVCQAKRFLRCFSTFFAFACRGRERGADKEQERGTGNWHSSLVANACWGNCILSAGRCLATNTPVNIHNNRKAIASRHSSRWNISLVCPRASQTGLGGKAERWTDWYQHREQLLSPLTLVNPGYSDWMWPDIWWGAPELCAECPKEYSKFCARIAKINI